LVQPLIERMARRHCQLRVCDPEVFLLLPATPLAHRHARILRTIPVDHTLYAIRRTLNMKAPFEVGWSEYSSMRLWRFSGNVLNQHTLPKFSEIGGSDGTRTRGLLRDRRSNQLN